MLPEVFEEFEVAYIFLATFCFLLSLSIVKRLTLGGGGVCSPLLFLRACSSVYTTDATCFDECFLFHVITGRH